jgi:formylglycine-generating enzyme required for sulfatase activity
MEIKIYTIEFEPPRWLRRLAPGALALVVLIGSSLVVRADTVAALTVFSDGEVLSASAINANFAALQASFNALPQVNPDCPWGYARDATITTYVVCKRGSDEVVKVGTDATAFWIDRYEASVWSAADGTGIQHGAGSDDYPATFPKNGQGYTAGLLYAASRAGVVPSAYITWFQANVACRASGKTLPSADQWLMAASLTPDPGTSTGDAGACLTSATVPRNTGGGTGACTSTWGIDDLIGNLSEWTEDWYIRADLVTTTNTYWMETDYNVDYLHNIGSSAYVAPGVWQANRPVVGVRGGSYTSTTLAGVFALALDHAPSGWEPNIGFRCVISR